MSCDEAVQEFLVELSKCKEYGYGLVELVGAEPLVFGGVPVDGEYLPNLGYDVVEGSM